MFLPWIPPRSYTSTSLKNNIIQLINENKQSRRMYSEGPALYVILTFLCKQSN